jgi:3-hydroxy-9,10-secoandrosta-1,3,5(10)-triene-9,17-dione monooxygenase reductase component
VDKVSEADAHRVPHGDVPDGMSSDARETWPSHDLIESWLGDSMYDFQFRPGEDTFVDADDPEAVASISGGAPVGLTCQSFSSVSLNPPLVLFIPARTSRAWPAIQRSGKFCVNFLSDDQAELSNQMASRGLDKFAGVSWEPAPATGSPMIEGTLGYVDCQIHHVHEAGDHYIVVGRVLDLAVHDAENALLFFEGKYTSTEGQAV